MNPEGDLASHTSTAFGLRHWAMLCAVLSVTACSRSTDRARPGEPPQPVSPLLPTAKLPAAVVASEVWRFELPAASDQSVARIAGTLQLPGGDFLVAVEFTSSLTIKEGKRLQSRGEEDVAILRLDNTGKLLDLHQLGGVDSDLVDGLLLWRDTPQLAIRTYGGLSVGGKPIVLPQTKSDDDSSGWLGVAIELDLTGRPVRTIASRQDAWNVYAVGTPTKDTIISYYLPLSEPEQSRIESLLPDGTTRWTKILPLAEASGVFPVDDLPLVATRRNNQLSVISFAPEDGTARTIFSHKVGPMDDAGRIGAVIAADGALFIYGDTAGDALVKRDNGSTESNSLEPFVAVVRDGTPTVKHQLLDVIGNVIAAGVVRGHPVAIVDVIHATALSGGTSVPTPGAYLISGYGPQTLVTPLSHKAGPDDVINPSFRTALDPLRGDTATLFGLCGENPDRYCVVGYRLAKK